MINESKTKELHISFNIVYILFFAFVIFGFGYLTYYYFILPFATIYYWSKTMQISILIISVLIMVVIFVNLIKGDSFDSWVDVFNFKTRGKQMTETQIQREIGVKLGDLKYQIKTENVGAVDNIYSQIIGLIHHLPSDKRTSKLEKLDELKFEMEGLKEKYHVA